MKLLLLFMWLASVSAATSSSGRPVLSCVKWEGRREDGREKKWEKKEGSGRRGEKIEGCVLLMDSIASFH